MLTRKRFGFCNRMPNSLSPVYGKCCNRQKIKLFEAVSASNTFSITYFGFNQANSFQRNNLPVHLVIHFGF